MTADPMQGALFTHRNHYLFADYYLDRRACARQEWREADADSIFAAVVALWRKYKPQGDNEAQTEADWIRPVLEALGHHYNVQVGMQTPLGAKVPDYVFYPDEATRQAAKRGVLTEADFQGALAVGDAKAWERPLDRAAPKEVSTLHENPSLQIDTYIRHSGLAWGILTNGRLWRLYHKDTSKKLDVYYEVDLPALIEQGDRVAFKYFWLFFRRQAFVPDAAAPAWLDLVLAESQAYEQGVSENLKAQVYDALRHLGQGFLDLPSNGLRPAPETLAEIHDNSLIVLYRLLFMLYAEARDLLPVHENRLYAEGYSFDAIKRRIAHDLDDNRPASPTMSGIWHDLYELWHVIDAGDAALGVPTYNGGLFRPDRHPFLERYRVGDLHLRQALDLLARALDPITGRREFVDYRDLEIRHLGSIYEGLLEYRLRCAAEPLIIVRQKGRERYDPAGDAAPDVSAGQVYLVTDKGERKATGSYYTPDYIVQYIIEQTVGPVLAERTALFRKPDGVIADEAGLAQAILGINCLDPAMGSGHFLVAAVEYIARYVVGLGLGTDEGRKTKDEASVEPELAYWRRRVAQACIYGVDLNPLAVELAKLSLWLATVSKDKPLSFLDHHLRCGNSLIGARVADLPLGLAPAEQVAKERKTAYKAQEAARKKEEAARAAGQITMLDDSAFAGAMHTASGMMRLIEDLGSETLADVHRAEEVYRDSVRAVTEKARLLGDVWTARHFGLALDETLWGGLSRYLLHGGFEMPAYRPVIDQARAIADARRFFHWELEFPEVFFDEHGRLVEGGGFDVVMGNPPYGLVKQDEVKRYVALLFEASYYQLDFFVAFVERGIKLARWGGYQSFIIPTTFMFEHYFEKLREFILGNTRIVELLHLTYPVFDQATVESAIYCLKVEPTDLREGTAVNVAMIANQETFSNRQIDRHCMLQATFERLPGKDFNIHVVGSRVDIVSKMLTGDVKQLAEIAEITVGIKPYQVGKGSPQQTRDVVEERRYDSDHKIDATYRQYLMGRDISRYALMPLEDRWISYGEWLAEPRPSAPFLDPLKLLIRQTGDSVIATVDTEQFLTLNNIHNLRIIDPDVHYGFLLAALNSQLITFFHQLIVPEAGRVFAEIKISDLQAIPIRHISFTAPAETRASLAVEAQRLAEAAVTTGDFTAVLAFVAAQLAAQPERSDVIHDRLAGLAEQMIAMNKQKGDEVRGFLAWLERETGARIEDLTGKSQLRDYLGDYQKGEAPLAFNDLLAILRKNARKLAADPGSRKFQESLKKEYEASLAMLLPLKARLAATDRLIDQVVYRLYGLTQEEIAIVEGRKDEIQTARMV